MLQPANFLTDHLFVGDAATMMARLPAGSVDLIVTSPPYWTAVEYDGAPSWPSYKAYLADLQQVWNECARVLRPNGKLCINAPILPIPKKLVRQHTRHLKNIAADIEQSILRATELARYSLFVWQKQTSKMMFGSYPFPGNILENNTVEFIHVYVKPGAPPKFPQRVKVANRLSRAEWLDLTQQVWFMYPQDVKRGGAHPAPFPEKLPARLIRLYSFGACENFSGELVLDPFAGTGTTCVAARRMGRRYIGIDVNERYLEIAAARLRDTQLSDVMLLVGRAKYPGRAELHAITAREAGTNGKAAARKHKKRTYGRGADRGLGRDPRQDAQQGIRRRPHALADAAGNHGRRRIEPDFLHRARDREHQRPGDHAQREAQGQARPGVVEGLQVRGAVRLFDAQLSAALLRGRARARSRHRYPDPRRAAAGNAGEPAGRQPRRLPGARSDEPARRLRRRRLHPRAVEGNLGRPPLLRLCGIEGVHHRDAEHLRGACQGHHRCDRVCHQAGKPQADRRGDRARQLPQPAGDRGRAGADRHVRGRARQRAQGAGPHRFRSVPVGILRGLDSDPDETLGQIKGDVDYKAVARQVFLATDSSKLMREAGLTPPASTSKSFVVMGKPFDPEKPEDYVKSFAIKRA